MSDLLERANCYKLNSETKRFCSPPFDSNAKALNIKRLAKPTKIASNCEIGAFDSTKNEYMSSIFRLVADFVVDFRFILNCVASRLQMIRDHNNEFIIVTSNVH